jgi:hypothetical protein
MSSRVYELSDDVTVYLVLNDFRTGMASTTFSAACLPHRLF